GNSGTSNANVTVSLSAASSQTVTVNYATLDGTATAGSDYTAASSSLTFAPGETSKTISIPVIGDTTVESDETFQVQLSNAASAVLSATASAATVTIINDDRLTPTVTVASNTSTLKAGDTATLTFTFNVIPIGFTASDISLSGGSVGGLSVDVTGKVYTATFTPTANTNSLNASISVAANSYTDSAGYNGAASNSLSLSGDTQAPTLTSSTPADNATGVALGSNLVLNFSETVQAGTGNIILSNGTDTRTIGISDTSQVSFSGTGVTINPTADLLGGGNYYLQLASGVIRDAAGNAYAGISDTTTLNVTTQATTSGIQATLTGTSGNDTLNGGTVNDALYGLEGNDLLNGYGGDDWLEGGEGYDTLSGGLGADTLVGGAVTGEDTGYNNLSGGAGNDSLIGGTILDWLYGEDGNDTILGGGGDDTIDGGAGNDSMMGGVGNDQIGDPGYGSNWINAGDGDDTIVVGYYPYTSYSTSDSTTITGGAGRDIYTLYGYGASLVIRDFAVGAGGDTLDINTILTSRSTGYTSGNPFGSLGYLRVQQEGADTVLQWDSDGAAGNSATWQTQARLQNLTASSLTGAN
ncbi:MAG: Calx-beta domain-containing protein, partial [Methylococcaceae bacterium]